MRVSADTHKSHGAAILRSASELFRARGLDAVSVAEVSAAAGLTHGAFYGHFASKAALAEAACRSAFATSADRFRARAAAARAVPGAADRDGLDAVIALYLTERHCDEPEHGCAIPTLGAELARAAPPLREIFAEGVESLLAVLAEEIAHIRPGADTARCRDAAVGVLSAMTGGLILARAFKDPERARAALTAASAAARIAATA